MCHQSAVNETVHTYSLTYGPSIIFLYMTGLGANFNMREVASSASSCANCHYDIYQDTFSTSDTQFLQVTCFHGFILVSVSLIPVYHHRIWYFPVIGGVKMRVAGCMFLRKGEMKKEREPDTPFCTMLYGAGYPNQ